MKLSEDAAVHNVTNLELRYSSVYILRGHQNLTVQSIHNAVVAGVKREDEKYSHLSVVLIGILDRCSSFEDAAEAAEFFIANKETIVEVDLVNEEENFDGIHLTRLFQICKGAGLSVTIHAGKTPSSKAPNNVEIAMDKFGATRIGHGIHVLRDENTLQKTKDAGIVF